MALCLLYTWRLVVQSSNYLTLHTLGLDNVSQPPLLITQEEQQSDEISLDNEPDKCVIDVKYICLTSTRYSLGVWVASQNCCFCDANLMHGSV